MEAEKKQTQLFVFFILLLLLSGSFNLFGVNNSSLTDSVAYRQIDSLCENLESTEILVQQLSGSEYLRLNYSNVEIYNLAASVFWNKKKYNEAGYLLNEAIHSIKESNVEKDVQMETYLLSSELFLKLHNTDSASHFLALAESEFDGNNIDTNKRILRNKARIANLNGNYLTEMEYYSALVEMLKNEPLPDLQELIQVYSDIGNLHSLLSDYNNACKYMDMAIDIALKNDLRKSLIYLYNNRGVIEKENNNFEQALEWYQKGLIFIQQNGTEYDLAQVYLNMGNIATELKNYQEAEDYFNQSILICKNLGLEYGILLNYVNLGNVDLSNGNAAEAITHLKKAEEMLDKHKNVEVEIIVNKNLANGYATEKKFDLAWLYLNKWQLLKDSIESADVKQKILELENKYQSELTQNEILTLNEKVLEQKARTRKYIIVLLTLLLVFIGAVSFGFYSRRLGLLKQKLAQKELDTLRFDMKLKDQELMGKVMNTARINEMFLAFSKEFKGFINEFPNSRVKEINNKFKELQIKFPDASWKEFEYRFDQVHADFNSKLLEKYPGLSPAELKICNFIILNLSSKDIAALINRSVKTVENTRNSIRKKMNLESDDNLFSVLSSIK